MKVPSSFVSICPGVDCVIKVVELMVLVLPAVVGLVVDKEVVGIVTVDPEVVGVVKVVSVDVGLLVVGVD